MTEKNYAPQKNEGKKMIVNAPKKTVDKTPIKKEIKKVEVPTPKGVPSDIVKSVNEGKETEKIESKDLEKEKTEEKKEEIKKESSGDEKKEEKKPVQTKPKVKKTEASVNETSIPVSTKHSVAICKFIKGKKIENAIADLEKVILQKKAVPMKGEIPHRKGMMSGRYPKKAGEYFVKILKRLAGNANVNEINDPVITTAIANLGSRPYGRFGRVRRKRTHVKLIAKEGREKKNRTKKVVKKESKRE